MSDRRFMENAIKKAEEGLEKDNSPFGACIVKNNEVIAVAHNTVLEKQDATCHAEINAIREASRTLDNFDLSDCTIYSTTEPCPMCFSAIHWARISDIVYGTNIDDVKKLGFSELSISNDRMKEEGNSKVNITKDFMREECLELLNRWKKRGSSTY